MCLTNFHYSMYEVEIKKKKKNYSCPVDIRESGKHILNLHLIDY